MIMKKNKNSERMKRYYKKIAKKYRKYPNEELSRFIGRKYSSINPIKRKKIKILEVGCGSGNNLWMISNEGFKSYGMDISSNAISLAKKVIKKKKLEANLKVGNMINLPYQNNYFDCVLDVFSSSSLDANEGKKFLSEVSRILKKNGSFFSYFPSKKSKMFKSKNKTMIDNDTVFYLKKRQTAYPIRNLPFRFLNNKAYKSLLKQNNIKTIYLEEIQKTYFQGREKFTFIVIEGTKFK
jgi:ubiquinone/menaquinone biosynthesis C-methylase UbiE